MSGKKPKGLNIIIILIKLNRMNTRIKKKQQHYFEEHMIPYQISENALPKHIL